MLMCSLCLKMHCIVARKSQKKHSTNKCQCSTLSLLTCAWQSVWSRAFWTTTIHPSNTRRPVREELRTVEQINKSNDEQHRWTLNSVRASAHSCNSQCKTDLPQRYLSLSVQQRSTAISTCPGRTTDSTRRRRVCQTTGECAFISYMYTNRWPVP